MRTSLTVALLTAMAPEDYETYAPFFDAVIQDYHKASADSVHTTGQSRG